MFLSEPKTNRKNISIIIKYCQRFLLFVFLSLCMGACTSQYPDRYLYPGGDDNEVQRICRIALNWKKQSFSIINGKIRIIDPRSAPYLALHKPLPDGIYHCSRADEGAVPCAKGATQTLAGERCSFTR